MIEIKVSECPECRYCKYTQWTKTKNPTPITCGLNFMVVLPEETVPANCVARRIVHCN